MCAELWAVNMGTQVRVRFAPSPTGFLHIGGARTALFNWLYARHTGGVFILRIEDTDVARNTRDAVDVILNGLRWLGIDWDEGPVTSDPAGPSKGDRGPYFQSMRGHIYARRVQELLSHGFAYESEGAIKFKMQREPVTIHDLIVGTVKRELTDREAEDPDFVIVRSDGQPVFHFTNVVDDIEMGITHVIRGEDHLSNTAKHIVMFRAFGVEPPKYAHIPLILNPDGTKMSKRDKGALLSIYQEQGYAPEAVVNYLCLLGWSPKDNREIMSLEEIVTRFDLPQIVRHNARFDMAKLQWMSGEYFRSMSNERFYALAIEALQRAKVKVQDFSDSYLRAALDTCKGKLKMLAELPAYAGFYFTDEFSYDAEAASRLFTEQNLDRLAQLRNAFASVAPFTAATLEQCLKEIAARLGLKPAELVHPLRLACTGKTIGPSLYHLLEVLGKDRVLARLQRALDWAATTSGRKSSSL